MSSHKEKILLVTGGSDPMGSEIDGTLDSHYNRSHSFAGQLIKSDRIFSDHKLVSICVGGVSNSFIVRNTLLWFDKNYDPDTTEVFVIVGWADSSRWESPVLDISDMKDDNPCAEWIAKENDDYLGISLVWTHPDREEFPEQGSIQKTYHEFITSFPEHMELISLNLALQLQWFFSSKQIPYIMTDTLYNVNSENPFVKPYINMIDQNRYINFGKPRDAFYYKYESMGYSNDDSKYYHHGEKAHLHYSQILEEHILKHNLL